jgi:hypothetical protein
METSYSFGVPIQYITPSGRAGFRHYFPNKSSGWRNHPGRPRANVN